MFDATSDGGDNVTPVDINGSIIIPAAWAGTWEITLTFRDCTTSAIRSVETITQRICPEDTLVNPFAPVFENCTGTRTGNHLDVDCDYQSPAGVCQVTLSVDFTIDVTGNALAGNARVESAATPGCNDLFVGGCQQVQISGTRMNSSTAGCDTLATARRGFLR